jgi:hypothetical protein
MSEFDDLCNKVRVYQECFVRARDARNEAETRFEKAQDELFAARDELLKFVDARTRANEPAVA